MVNLFPNLKIPPGKGIIKLKAARQAIEMKREKLKSGEMCPTESPNQRKSPAEKPVSLNPLSVEEALAGLLATGETSSLKAINKDGGEGEAISKRGGRGNSDR